MKYVDGRSPALLFQILKTSPLYNGKDKKSKQAYKCLLN